MKEKQGPAAICPSESFIWMYVKYDEAVHIDNFLRERDAEAAKARVYFYHITKYGNRHYLCWNSHSSQKIFATAGWFPDP